MNQSLLLKYSKVEAIAGSTITIKVPEADKDSIKGAVARYNDIAIVENPKGEKSLARVTRCDGDQVTLMILNPHILSTDVAVTFLGHPMQVTYSDNIFGRIFNGSGEPIDNGPALEDDVKVEIGGASVNPVKRVLPSRMVRTDVPMIDVFNCLVESQKIPIFSVAGEPYNKLLSQVGIYADADVVIFGGIGLIFDDYHFFRTQFEEAGVFGRTVMFTHLASDPIVEALLVPDMALAVAEKFAVEENKKVLVLLSDMTAYADAIKEVGISMEQIPSNRGYTGDLYSQLARRYEKACDYDGAGSVTILSATTMPGNDVTHPVPDNTGYITEGQFYLHGGMLDPFGSLSRLKQHVVDDTREDHSQIMNVMIRFYSGGRDAEQKQAMSFELSAYDEKLLKFSGLFKKRFMDVNVTLPLEDALDLCWQTLAECFDKKELMMKDEIVEKFFPEDVAKKAQAEAAAA